MKFCDLETMDAIFRAMKRTAGLYTDDLGREDLMIQLIALVLSPKINNSSFSSPISSHSMSDNHNIMAMPKNSRTLFKMSLPCATKAGFSFNLQPLPPWVNPPNPSGQESENPIRVGFWSTSPFIELPWCACSSSLLKQYIPEHSVFYFLL